MSAFTDLLLQGPRPAAELRQHLNISQATFSRLVAAEPQVIQFGKARATRYALLRPAHGLSRLPLWKIDETGMASKYGDLFLCWPQGSCLVIPASGEAQWFDGLPWYLTDLRPQGFLGRVWGRRIAGNLGLPEDIRLWQEEDVLYALSVFHGENAGGWLIAQENYQRWVTAPTPRAIAEAEKLTRYPQFAAEVLAGEVVGSSAGGEQPKFTAFAQTASGEGHVLVKFSVEPETVMAQRWADLLIAESVALHLLEEAGVQASRANPYISPARQVFLESQRFDCVGEAGRRAIVSLEAVQSEFCPSPGNWPQTAQKLAEERVIEHETQATIAKIWAFGRLIANSDMHAGNLSFFLSEKPLRLAPVYDMLPMAFAPSAAGYLRDTLPEIRFDALVAREAWQFALPLAQVFWQRVAADERISEDFQSIALEMGVKLQDVERMIQRTA
jgi:Uncharacterized protein related to capsule biosynthesis enzymes